MLRCLSHAVDYPSLGHWLVPAPLRAASRLVLALAAQITGLGGEKFPSGNICICQTPMVLGNDHSCQKVITAGIEHPVIQQRSRRQNARHLTSHLTTLGCSNRCVFYLIADSDRIPFSTNKLQYRSSAWWEPLTSAPARFLFHPGYWLELVPVALKPYRHPEKHFIEISDSIQQRVGY